MVLHTHDTSVDHDSLEELTISSVRHTQGISIDYDNVGDEPINPIFQIQDITIDSDKLEDFMVNSVIFEKDREDTVMDIIKLVTVSTISYKDVSINPSLPLKDKGDLLTLVKRLASIFLDI